ncbi:Uncharacterized protein SCF082_LOCUS6477 [Durusdinium trenchii]|uniref:Uncharacterized protein n=1 Tax=Durusdinium trenchii TaxID=1381693 RepID=A0ABP0IDL9_9DINO
MLLMCPFLKMQQVEMVEQVGRKTLCLELKIVDEEGFADIDEAQRGHFGVVVRSEFGPLQLLQMANHVAVDDLKARWTQSVIRLPPGSFVVFEENIAVLVEEIRSRLPVEFGWLPGTLRVPIVETQYSLVCHRNVKLAWTEQQLVEVVPVGFVQGKLLVAAPLGAWHRTVAKRVLPARALSKAVVVEVGLCSPFQREAAEPEEVVRLWMGFLAETYVGALRPIAEMDEIGLAFAEGEFTSYLPLADGMREAAQEHFAFESATEGIPRSSTSMRTRADDVGSPALSSEHRMTRIRDDGEVGRTGRHDDSPSAFTKFACHTYSAFGLEKERGVEEDALAQMQRLMQDGQKKQKKLADPGSSPCPPGLTVNATARTGLSEWTQEVDGGEPAAASGLGQHTEESPIVHAVTKLAEIMSVLAADKMKRGKGSVEAALDGISSPGVAESGSLGSGKRAAAARRALRTALQENPSEIHQLLERAMLEDLTSQTLVPGQPAPVLCSRAWIEHRSRIGHWKTAAYTAWTAGGALDCLIKGDVAGGRARLCLLLLMLDQTACDRGSWTLSSELSLESSPPMAVLGQHQPPAVAEGFHVEAAEVGQEGSERSRRRSVKVETKSKGQSCREEQPSPDRPMRRPGQSQEGMPTTETVKVPGINAPAINVPKFLNSWPRLLLKGKGALATFVHSMLSGNPTLRDEGTPPSLLWPVPVPYPEAFRSGEVAALWRKRRTCVQLMVLDWLYLGRPDVAPRRLRLGQKLTLGQWRIVRLLEELAEDGNSVQVVDASGMGRSAAKIETQDEELGALHRAVTQLQQFGGDYVGSRKREASPSSADRPEPESLKWEVIGDSGGSSYVTAKSLVADRIVFGAPPAFDPVPYMDSKTAAMYNEPSLFHRSDPLEPPRVAVRATRSERLRLFTKMAACGRLVYLSPQEIEEKYASGLFGVVKDFSRDRLIMDSRPPNGREEGLNHWCGCLAGASLLNNIELHPEEDLLMSGQDIKDFFYQFVVGRSRAARNVLAGRLTRSEIATIFPEMTDIPPQGGFVGLNTMAMGDLCAVEFAQCSHISLMLQYGALQPNELLRLRAPIPRGPYMLGLVIDDLVLLEPVISDKGYTGAGMWPLILVTMRVCCLGVVSIGLLESLAGSWISIFLFRRRCLAAMNEIFDALSAGLSANNVIRLSATLAEELYVLSVLGTLSYVNIRAQSLERITATDASDWGMAAVSASLPLPVVKEAMRHSLSKSLWTKLLPPGKAWLKEKGMLEVEEELLGSEPYDVHPFWEISARSLQYSENWRRPHGRKVHINLGELNAHLIEEKNLCQQNQSFRSLYALDSQVALGCLVKGRSSSKAINRLLTRSLPTILGADAYGSYGFFPSALNRADDPTRACEVGPPDRQLPEWWGPLAEGDHAPFDAWLHRLGKQHANVRETHDFAELGWKAGLKLMTGKQKRSAEHFHKVELQEAGAGFTRPRAHVPKSPPEVQGEGVPVEAVAILQQLDKKRQIWWRKGCEGDFTKPGALDLFTGEGGVARQLKLGCPFVVTYEWLHSVSEDLLDEENRRQVLKLIELEAVKVCGSALICRSFSRAITPPVRSKRYPRGLPWMARGMKAAVAEGNAHYDFALIVLAACERHNVLFGWKTPMAPFFGSRKVLANVLGLLIVLKYFELTIAGSAPRGENGPGLPRPVELYRASACFAHVSKREKHTSLFEGNIQCCTSPGPWSHSLTHEGSVV